MLHSVEEQMEKNEHLIKQAYMLVVAVNDLKLEWRHGGSLKVFDSTIEYLRERIYALEGQQMLLTVSRKN